MKTLTVYDPAMCCSTGICGTDIDQQLVNFAADLDWLKSQGVEVTRFNLSSEPALFAENELVKAVLQEVGVEGLPVILADDDMQTSGTYPDRAQLAQMAGMTAAEIPDPAPVSASACCGETATTEKTSSGCC